MGSVTSSPGSATVTATDQEAARTVTIGIDGAVNGFNPYNVADFSSASRTVASLVLPSVSTVAADGTVRFDPRLVQSAAVTESDPFTVTYDLVRGAAWSDGTPVTAEDFRYLRNQLIATNGTIGAKPYASIKEIRSLDAGKKVVVVFSTPVQDWQSMFSPLLPAHILKDAPGGFTAGLADGVPVSAGPYRLQSVDRVTGLVTLVRNDKFWGTQPGPSTVLLRIGTGTELVSALQRGDVQALFFRPNSTAAEQLATAVPADRRIDVPLPATVQLAFDTRSKGPVGSAAVRRAVAAGLSADVIADALTGSRSEGLLEVTSMVRLPAQPDAAPGPGGTFGNAEVAAKELAAAGYRLTSVYATKDGVPLRVSLGFATGDPRIAATAKQIQQQLGRVGIEVDLLVDTAGGIVDRLTRGQLDLALLTVPRGSSDAVAAASSFGCPGADLVLASNLTGYCSASVQPTLTAVLTGAGTVNSLEQPLWADLPIIPLGQPTAVFAVAPALGSVIRQVGPGWLWTGPLAAVAGWPG